MLSSHVFWKKLLLVSLGWFVLVFSAYSADWDSCADDLDRLHRAARDASDKANEVKTKADEFDSCKRYPDVHDLLKDKCRSKNADYQSALTYLENELRTIDSRIRSVRSSCGFDLGSTGSVSPNISRPQPTPISGNSMCDVFRPYKGRLPYKTLFETCSKSMSEVDCRKCLSDN